MVRATGQMTRTARDDLLIYVDPGPSRFPTDIHGHLGIKVAYFIDVHIDIESRLEIAPLFDLVFVAQRDYVEGFRERGILQAQWLPLAADPDVHHAPGLERDVDVGFIGKLGL